MPLSWENITREVQNLLSDKGAVGLNTIRRFQNMAQRDIGAMHDWPNLLVRDFVSLTAPYTTGTVSTSGTTVTGSGTTFTSGMVGRKFAKDYNSPWYEISAFGSTTSLTLADSYAETDLSASTYVIYDDTIALPSGAETVLGVWLHDTNRRLRLDDVTQEQLPFWGPNQEWGGYVRQADKPYQYVVIENDSSGILQLQVGPYAPDDDYRLEVTYRKDVTDNEMSLVQRLEPALIFMTLSYCYERDFPGRAAQMEARAMKKVQDAWHASRRAVEVFQVGQMTHPDITDPAPFYVNYRSLEGQ